jgi:type I restriction enzyme S subunit
LLITIVGAKTGSLCRFDKRVDDHYVCQSVALMRLVFPDYSEYLELYFQAVSGGKRQHDRYIYGAGRPHLSFEQLRMTVVPIPDLAEAQLIVSKLSANLSEIGHLEDSIKDELQRARALRQSILKKAFSGQLVPQDPDDEPASVLLERIKAEKAARAEPPRLRRGPRTATA